MKKIFNTIVLLLSLSPISILAHDGHVHTGTFWENVIHFSVTNGYIILPTVIAAYFVVRYFRAIVKVKNK